VLAFVVYDTLIAFIPTLDQRLNTYPFSSFPMFSQLRVRAPYDEHLPYDVVADHFAVTGDAKVHVFAQRWFDHTNRGTHAIRDPERLRAKLAAILGQADRRYPELGLRQLRHEVTIFEAPAYPAPAHLEPHLLAVLGTYGEGGHFATVLGELADTPRGTLEVTLHPIGVDASRARLAYVVDDLPVLHDLPGTRTGDRFEVTRPEGDPLYIVALIPDATGAETPWLVASRAAWRWQ
jgi:hypothetical protein